MLGHFFERPWHEPVSLLSDDKKGFILNAAGYCLRSVGRLREALQPAQAALSLRIANQNWGDAAVCATNVSDLYLLSGDLKKALHAAEQSVDLAEQHNDRLNSLTRLAVVANIQHHLGQTTEALDGFKRAEQLLQEARGVDFLYSMPGFWYCDLLLAEKCWEEVKVRATTTLDYLRKYEDLLSIAIDNLSLGRAVLADHKGKQVDLEAGKYFQLAVDGLRRSGKIDVLPRGLLARSEFYRVTMEFEKAERDLIEVHRIARRSEMHLYLADFELESARLNYAQDKKDAARSSIATAKELINRLGYHRRDQEVAELEAQLC